MGGLKTLGKAEAHRRGNYILSNLALSPFRWPVLVLPQGVLFLVMEGRG